jgi:glycosyltransferase involved in cell wall biosynthesis
LRGSPAETAPKLLVICHLSASDEARAAGRKLATLDGSVDLLVFGRSSDEYPERDDVRVIALPSFRGSHVSRARTLFGFLARLRRSKYDVVLVAHPALMRSRSRGLLLSFPFLVGAKSVLANEPPSQRARRIRPLAALVDLGAWAASQLLSELLVKTITGFLERSPTQPGSAPLPESGPVVYLRTDVEMTDAPLSAGGSAAHTEGIIRALRHRGHPVDFWSTLEIAGMSTAVSRQPLPKWNPANVPVEITEVVSGLLQILRLQGRRERPAFVYQRYSLNNFAGVVLAQRWRCPLVLEANAAEAAWREQWSSLRFGRLARASERFIFQHAARLTTVSDNAAREVLAAGASPERLRVVANGVNVEDFAEAMPQALPFPPESFVVGFAGLFYPWHGVSFLADAFVRLLRDVPEARLLLVGDGEDRPRVSDILHRGNALEATYAPGLLPRSEIPGFLASADVLVSPHAPNDDFIGSPIKVFEYMATGRAIVASRVAQLGEVLEHQRTALLVEPGDPVALGEALARLHGDPELRARLGQAAQAEARARYSWDARLEQALSPPCR